MSSARWVSKDRLPIFASPIIGPVSETILILDLVFLWSLNPAEVLVQLRQEDS